jgi:hypothetical protein
MNSNGSEGPPHCSKRHSLPESEDQRKIQRCLAILRAANDGTAEKGSTLRLDREMTRRRIGAPTAAYFGAGAQGQYPPLRRRMAALANISYPDSRDCAALRVTGQERNDTCKTSVLIAAGLIGSGPTTINWSSHIRLCHRHHQFHTHILTVK